MIEAGFYANKLEAGGERAMRGLVGIVFLQGLLQKTRTKGILPHCSLSEQEFGSFCSSFRLFFLVEQPTNYTQQASKQPNDSYVPEI